MLDLFRSLFAPPRHLILVLAALWLGLALAERRSARHDISKEASQQTLGFYSVLGYIIGEARPFCDCTHRGLPEESAEHLFVEYRALRSHAPIGKVSFTADQLRDNLQAFLDTILKAKPSAAKGTYLRSATISSTMGPGVRLDTSGYR